MQSARFGLGVKYDDGNDPSVAMNRHGTVLEVHKNEAGDDLYRRVGRIRGATVDWGPVKRYEDSGRSPGCALNAHGVTIEVHKNNGTTLFYSVGKVTGNDVQWGSTDDYDSGVTPDVDLNDGGTVVEVHCTESPFSNALYYHVGKVEGERISFGKSHKYADKGKDPKVSISNDGLVVVVHNDRSSEIRYRVGRIRESSIDFDTERKLADGDRADVALLDDGRVVIVYASGSRLMQRSGCVEGTTITWDAATKYDEGSKPAVAAAGDMAVELHVGQSGTTLWFCNSLITDRASWMSDRMATLGRLPLRNLALPAAHDAFMYEGGLTEDFARTQDLSIYEQLSYGIRYFDIRPKWNGKEMITDHGGVAGPKMETILGDVQKFLSEGRRELIILKLSHFADIDAAVYRDHLVPQVERAIGKWMYKSLPANVRLAGVTLADYTRSGPAVLVVVGNGLASNSAPAGFWYYRDSDSGDAAAGALRVFDQYSDSKDESFMKNDQRKKFEEYDGLCHPASTPEKPVECDLFLFSWTLTPKAPPALPPYQVWAYADDVNPLLGKFMADLPVPNRHGQIVNLLYVDYVEWARVTDVAILQNEAGGASASRETPESELVSTT